MSSSRLVYSTDTHFPPPSPVARESLGIKGDTVIKISWQSKGRKAKGVTLLSGFHLSRTELRNLAKHLKRGCCTGGTIKNDQIEIQGDQRDKLIQLLTNMGFQTQKVGG
ncbi:MAG: hypothetical protein CBC09_05330 [Cellvibrionales bacterium TMED49]|nr:stress response translation initiation inhibitor YciH [Porticoccaceae bacterium]OUU38497.1 MAG: hypothetical protein CBC09_05330 [Cellvibrionales bacterium TMED49]